MTVLQMPDGAVVDFGARSKAEIQALVVKKFPQLAPGGQGQMDNPSPTVSGAMAGASEALQPVPGPAASWVDKLAGAVGAPTSSDVRAGNYDNNFGGALNKYATFGLSDDAAGLAKAATGGDFNAGAAASRAGTDQFAQEHPVANATAAVLGSVGSIGPGKAVVPAAPLTKGGIIKQSMKAGAVSGGLGGFGNSTGDLSERAWDAVGGAGVGTAVGGALGAAALPFSRTRVPGAPAQTMEKVKDSADKAYKAAEKEGLLIEPKSFKTVVDDIEAAANNAGIHHKITPDSHAALEELRKAADSGAAVNLTELRTKDALLNNAAGNVTKPKDQWIAIMMREKLDHFANNLKPADVIASDPKKAMELIGEGNKLWARFRRSETIDKIFRDIEIDEATVGRGKATMNNFKKLAKNDAEMKRFSKEQQKDIRFVARGGNLNQVLRWAGGLRGVAGSILGGMVGGIPGAVGVPAAGMGMNALAGRNVSKNAHLLQESVLSGAKRKATLGGPAPKIAATAARTIPSYLVGN